MYCTATPLSLPHVSMPPRHRAALGPASAVTLTSLPDDLIVRCLAPLSLEKR